MSQNRAILHEREVVRVCLSWSNVRLHISGAALFFFPQSVFFSRGERQRQAETDRQRYNVIQKERQIQRDRDRGIQTERQRQRQR